MAFDFEIESLKMAFESIRERKLRSILTVLGIVIGIGAIIAMVSIGTGTNAAVGSALSGLGSNTILIASGGGGTGGGFGAPSISQTITNKDLTAIQGIKGVSIAIGLFIKGEAVTFQGNTKVLSVFGVDTKDAQKFFTDLGVVQMDEGRYFRSGEKHAVVLGHNIAAKSFANPIKVGDKLTINNETIHVIGIIKETGTSQYDSIMIAPVDDVRDPATQNNQYTILFAKATGAGVLNQTANAIQKKMDDFHGKKNFVVYTTQQLTQQIGTVTNTISIVLGGVAGIALVVAGIGIANTMLMSVIERTKEIGIMKSIGATNRNVMEIFLMESATIGLIGGLVGGLVGIVLANILGIVLNNYGLPFKTEVTPGLFLFGLGFSVIVGVLFGLLPARSAAKLNPIEALRHE